MKGLFDILEEQMEKVQVQEDEVLFCEVCGKKRQFLVAAGTTPRVVRCTCDCEEAAYRQRREQLQKQEQMDRFARLRSADMMDPALRKCTFENSEYESTALQIARNYVSQWPEMQKKGLGLLFWGPCGTGKTYLAACIANALEEQEVPVLMTSLGRMLSSIPGPASGQQAAAIDQWMKHPLLIVDDLGAERETAYAADLVYQIIDACYRSGKPMVITTNLTMEEMEDPDSREKARIYERILERCTPVCVNERSIRNLKRGQNRKDSRKYLSKNRETSGDREVASRQRF